MTSKLKCPFCGAELGKEQGSERWWYCVNAKCVHKYTTTHETIWQALIQAKQDLVIAKSTLEYLGYEFAPEYPEKNVIAEMRQKARDAVKYIEHKE